MVNDKNNAYGVEKHNKKSNGEQSDLCDLEQVTLKPQLQVHHYLTTWLQIWYHSLLWGDSIRDGADLEKQNCLFGVHPAVMGKLTSLSLLICLKNLNWMTESKSRIALAVGIDHNLHCSEVRKGAEVTRSNR